MPNSRRDRRLAFVGAFSVIAGVVIAATGSRDDRFGGAVVALFGLVMLAVPASGWLLARNAQPPRIEHVEHGVGGLLTLLARGPYRIVLLRGALRWELGTRPSSVAWEDIESVRLFDISGSPFLGLDARPGTLRTPSSQRWLARVNRGISGADGQIALEAFRVDPRRLAAVIADCAHDARRRGEIGKPGSLAWLSD